jgi:hypothetical protein
MKGGRAYGGVDLYRPGWPRDAFLSNVECDPWREFMSETGSEILQSLREVFARALMQHARTTIAQSAEREFDISHAGRKFIEIQTAIEAIDRAIASHSLGVPPASGFERPAEY